MVTPLLVPLDGSQRAASALPVAAYIAETTHAPLLLARITPLLGVPPAAVEVPLPSDTYQQLIEDERRMAADYLDNEAGPLRQRGLTVETFVAHGDPAATLLDLAAERQVSLMVMTTHGRSGLTRFALGSIADRLVHYGHVPILLLRTPPEDGEAGGERRERLLAARLEHALVPLDGSVLAEAALDCAAALAGTVVQRITLVRVVPYSAKPCERLEAAEYLETCYRALREALAGRACLLDTLLLEGTAAAEQIAQHAEVDGGLVVMATHGRGGLMRWVLGSVADEVLHRSNMPVLVVHPEPVAPSSEQPANIPESVPEVSSLPRTAPLRETAKRFTL
jgi:nucleotide-binding universal stress UspA family protein